MTPLLHPCTAPPPLPPRPTTGHKGTFGHVLIVGGSEAMLGAPVLAGTAAYRAGAGYVTAAMPRSVLAAALSVTPEIVGLAVGRASDRAKVLEVAAKVDAVVVGPGLGRQAGAKRLLLDLIALAGKPTVVDADGLNLLAAMDRWPAAFAASAVLTPHPGEMRRLGRLIGRDGAVPTDDPGRIELACAAAAAFGQVVVLKGERTVVADPPGEGGGRVYVNGTGDSSLSKAGSGDVLSGVVAAFLGQGVDRFEAACLAVHLHGRAGERAGAAIGRRSVLARDVIDHLPAAIRERESDPS